MIPLTVYTGNPAVDAQLFRVRVRELIRSAQGTEQSVKLQLAVIEGRRGTVKEETGDLMRAEYLRQRLLSLSCVTGLAREYGAVAPLPQLSGLKLSSL